MTAVRPPVFDVAVRRSFGAAAHRFELDVVLRSDARRVALFGPSGAGKSLTLRAMAGLLALDAGHVRVGATTLFDARSGIDLAPDQRRLGCVFQEYALFPHLDVRQNIAFSLRTGWRNPARNTKDDRIARALESFGLESVASLYPDQLSGGQRQRVALARTLVAEPRALLLDEPFAALDTPLRQRLRDELAELQSRLAIPMLLITHDEADLATLADEVIGMEYGRVVHTTATRVAAGDIGA